MTQPQPTSARERNPCRDSTNSPTAASESALNSWQEQCKLYLCALDPQRSRHACSCKMSGIGYQLRCKRLCRALQRGRPSYCWRSYRGARIAMLSLLGSSRQASHRASCMHEQKPHGSSSAQLVDSLLCSTPDLISWLGSARI